MAKKTCTLKVSRPTKKLIRHLLRHKVHFVLQRKSVWQGQWDSTIHSKSEMPKHPKSLYAEKFVPGSFDGDIGRSFSCSREVPSRRGSCTEIISNRWGRKMKGSCAA